MPIRGISFFFTMGDCILPFEEVYFTNLILQEQKMDKKKMREPDPISENIAEDCDTFEIWFIGNWKKVMWGCAVILILVAVWFTIGQIRKNAEAKYRAAFAEALTQTQLEQALGKYPEGTVSCEGRARLAKLYLKADNTKGALEQFALIAADPKAPLFTKGRAILDSGYVLEKTGKYREALAKYERAASSADLGEEIRCEGWYAAGRMQILLKNTEKARAAFKRAMPARPRSMASFFWKSQAQAALERLPSVPAPAAPAKK